jgi:hypothetical protein
VTSPSPRPTREEVDAALLWADDYNGVGWGKAGDLADEVRALRAEQAQEVDVAARAINDLRHERDELRAALAARTPQPVEPEVTRPVGALRHAGGNVDRWNGRGWVPTVIVAGSTRQGPWTEDAAPQPAVPDGEDATLRPDCGSPEHEWARCRQCPTSGPCACAGGPCCQREHAVPDGEDERVSVPVEVRAELHTELAKLDPDTPTWVQAGAREEPWSLWSGTAEALRAAVAGDVLAPDRHAVPDGEEWTEASDADRRQALRAALRQRDALADEVEQLRERAAQAEQQSAAVPDGEDVAARRRWAAWLAESAAQADDLTEGEAQGMRIAATHLLDDDIAARVASIDGLDEQWLPAFTARLHDQIEEHRFAVRTVRAAAASPEDVPARLEAAADACEALGWTGTANTFRDLASQLREWDEETPDVRAAVAAALARPTGHQQ